MANFTITTADEKTFTVSADNYTDAANKAAKKLFGKKVTANRTTGSLKMSGYFQAYEPVRGGGQNSVGNAFHVR